MDSAGRRGLLGRMRLGKKLLLAFLVVGVVPFAAVSFFSVLKASNALSGQAFDQLTVVREIKKSQIQGFFRAREADLGVLLETIRSLQNAAFTKLATVQELKKSQLESYFASMQAQLATLGGDPFIREALGDFAQAYEAAGETTRTPTYLALAEDVDPRMRDIMHRYGWYDIFLIQRDGDIVYTVEREADLGMSIPLSDLKDSGLGKAFAQLVGAQDGHIAVADFEPYAPAGGQQTAFMMTQVRDADGDLLGALAFQVPTDQTNEIVQRRDGMGTSGETYVVGNLGETVAFRSDMVTMGEGKYVVGYPITTPYIQEAIAGNQGSGVYTDSAGKLVLVAYAPLQIAGLDWACITKMDLEEAIVTQAAEQREDYFAKYIERYGYYDLFLIHPQGSVFYTVNKEEDYGSNMLDGPYADSGLGQLTRRVLEEKDYAIADFAPYAPSNNEPAAFIAVPAIQDGEVTLIVALQLSIDAINAIMTQRDGMGETGESYLVGPDKLMRSDSYLDPEYHTVRASFANPDRGQVDTLASREALAGREGAQVITDYQGSRVLSAYAPVPVAGLDWAILAEIDEAEAFSAVSSLKAIMLLIGIVGVAGIIAIALVFAATIVRPVRNVVESLSALAQGEGDLTARLPVKSGDEIGELALRFNEFIEKLQTMIKDIASGIGTLSSSSTELSAVSDQLTSAAENTAGNAGTVAAAIEEMSSNLNGVSAAMEQTATNANMISSASEEMSSAIGEIARSTDNARAVSSKAVEQAQSASAKVIALGEAAQEIDKVTEAITEISEQTNLLALNATIEAARAGEAGKGFAVVANEIKELASKTAQSTTSIRDQIGGIQNSTDATVVEIGAITDVIREVNETVANIATSIAQQTQATQEISTNISQTSQGVSEVNDNVAQSSGVASEITREIAMVNTSAKEMSTSSAQVRESANELSRLAERLHELVNRFKIDPQ